MDTTAASDSRDFQGAPLGRDLHFTFWSPPLEISSYCFLFHHLKKKKKNHYHIFHLSCMLNLYLATYPDSCRQLLGTEDVLGQSTSEDIIFYLHSFITTSQLKFRINHLQLVSCFHSGTCILELSLDKRAFRFHRMAWVGNRPEGSSGRATNLYV